MKAKRKTMLGVAFAVAVIALAGVGYAAVTYNATTETAAITGSSNAYAVINVTSDSPYTSHAITEKIDYDTKRVATGESGVQYKLHSEEITILTFTVTETNITSGSIKATITGDSITEVPSVLGASTVAWKLNDQNLTANMSITANTTYTLKLVLTSTDTYIAPESPATTPGSISISALTITVTDVGN